MHNYSQCPLKLDAFDRLPVDKPIVLSVPTIANIVQLSHDTPSNFVPLSVHKTTDNTVSVYRDGEPLQVEYTLFDTTKPWRVSLGRVALFENPVEVLNFAKSANENTWIVAAEGLIVPQWQPFERFVDVIGARAYIKFREQP